MAIRPSEVDVWSGGCRPYCENVSVNTASQNKKSKPWEYCYRHKGLRGAVTTAGRNGAVQEGSVASSQRRRTKPDIFPANTTFTELRV